MSNVPTAAEGMLAVSDPLAELSRAMQAVASLPQVPRREFRCGHAILQWLKTLSKPAVSDVPTASFWGVPIVLDSDLGRGTWAYFEDGVEMKRSRVGDGDRVWFVNGQFITTDDDLMAEALDGNTEPLFERMAEEESDRRFAARGHGEWGWGRE